jgi:poly-gamma-glutamate synthase PgsB/CapB
MTAFEFLFIFTAGLIGLGLLEAWSHRQNLFTIPIRIHVSGTRGKSSVARMIYAGLREGGIIAAAKTTGTLARMILPNGMEAPIFRPSGANIIEQTRIVSTAAELGVKALVIECMALQPEYHWLSENKLVKATHGVITNARADHLDVMGPGEADVAKALAGMIPLNGTLYTAECKHLQIIAEACKDRHTRLVPVGAPDVAAVTSADLAGFPYTEHAENVALALKILTDLGVSRETAMRGMWKAPPDPGVLTIHRLDFFGRDVTFVNGFAANDPQSSEMIWDLCKKRYLEKGRRLIAVFNLRGDRPHRTIQLAGDVDFWHEADNVVLMGTGAYLFARIAASLNYDVTRFVFAEEGRIEDIFENIIGVCGAKALVIGMGNIGGQGLSLVRYFRNRAIPEERT